jgi:hypothetical protein
MFVYICRIGYPYREKVANYDRKITKERTAGFISSYVGRFIDMNHELEFIT